MGNANSIEEYARRILEENGCDEHTYWGYSGKVLIDDLKSAYPNGLEFNYIDVTNAILEMSKPRLLVRSPYKCVWDCDTGGFIDGCSCESFEDAMSKVFDTLVLWLYDFAGNEEDFEMMIENDICYVQKYNEKTDEYEDFWYPSDDELKEIGWFVPNEQSERRN